MLARVFYEFLFNLATTTQPRGIRRCGHEPGTGQVQFTLTRSFLLLAVEHWAGRYPPVDSTKAGEESLPPTSVWPAACEKTTSRRGGSTDQALLPLPLSFQDRKERMPQLALDFSRWMRILRIEKIRAMRIDRRKRSHGSLEHYASRRALCSPGTTP